MPSVECYNAMVLQNGLQEFVIGVDCTGIVTSIRIEEAGRAYSALVIGKTRVQVPCKDQLIPIREGGQSAIQKLEPGTSSFFGVCVGMICKLVCVGDGMSLNILQRVLPRALYSVNILQELPLDIWAEPTPSGSLPSAACARIPKFKRKKKVA